MGDPTGGLFSAANAAQGGADAAAAGDAGNAGIDPSAGMSGFDPSLGMGGGFDPSMGGGMGDTFGQFAGGPIPGDPTGSAAAQQSITGAVPGSQPPISDQPASSRGLGQQQAPPPPPQPPPQQYKTASEALWGGPRLSGTPGGPQFASLTPSGNPLPPADTDPEETNIDPSQRPEWTGNVHQFKATDANLSDPWARLPNTRLGDPSATFSERFGATDPNVTFNQRFPAIPQSSDSFKDRFQPFAKPATEAPDRPLWSDTMLPPQPLNPPTAPATPPAVTSPAVTSPAVTSPAVTSPANTTPSTGTTPPTGGMGGQVPPSPLEQLVGQFLHMIMGGQGGLEQMIMRALGIHPRQMFPQYFGGGFNPPPPTPGGGYFPAGATGGRPGTPGTIPAPGGKTGSPPLPRPGPPGSPGNPPSTLPPSARTEDIPRPPGEIGPNYNPSSYTRQLIQIESSGNPNNITGKGAGANYGLGQFSKDQWKHFGITEQNWRDPRVQMRAIQQEANENIPKMRSALGRNPTSGELYLAHQQNVPEAIALIKSNPNTPAWQVVRPFYHSDRVAMSAIGGNNLFKTIPADRMTAGQFVNMWRNRFNRGLQ